MQHLFYLQFTETLSKQTWTIVRQCFFILDNMSVNMQCKNETSYVEIDTQGVILLHHEAVLRR